MYFRLPWTEDIPAWKCFGGRFVRFGLSIGLELVCGFLFSVWFLILVYFWSFVIFEWFVLVCFFGVVVFW